MTRDDVLAHLAQMNTAYLSGYDYLDADTSRFPLTSLPCHCDLCERMYYEGLYRRRDEIAGLGKVKIGN